MVPEATSATPLNEFQRLGGVLIDPKRTFADIAARPRWWAPLVLVSVLAVTFTYCFSQRVGWETFMRQEMEKNSRFQQLTTEQKERIIDQQVGLGGNLRYIITLVTVPLMALLMAGVLTLVFKVFLGGNFTFKQVFAVTSYSLLTGAISSSLALLVLYLKPPEEFNLRNPLAFNVGAYLPGDTPAWLMSVATSVDLFAIWTMLLLATGISVVDQKLAWGKCFAWILICWLVFVLGRAGVSSMFG